MNIIMDRTQYGTSTVRCGYREFTPKTKFEDEMILSVEFSIYLTNICMYYVILSISKIH